MHLKLNLGFQNLHLIWSRHSKWRKRCRLRANGAEFKLQALLLLLHYLTVLEQTWWHHPFWLKVHNGLLQSCRLFFVRSERRIGCRRGLYFQLHLKFDTWSWVSDTLAEWLRRRPAKPMGSPCVGSNPTGVVFAVALLCHRCPVHCCKQGSLTQGRPN